MAGTEPRMMGVPKGDCHFWGQALFSLPSLYLLIHRNNYMLQSLVWCRVRLGTSLVLSAVCLWLATGCETVPISPVATSSAPPPTLTGSFYRVRRGETLWRIAHTYGLDPDSLADANRLSPTAALIPGQRLFIPLPRESAQFVWPLRGSVGSSSAARGINIAAPPGSLVRASRSGRVAVATRHLSGWGTTVVIDHLDGYLSIYARLHQILVSPGSSLRQGTPLGSLGTRALHFEIRYGVTPKNTLSLLPAQS